MQYVIMALARLYEIDDNTEVKDRGIIAVTNLVNLQVDKKKKEELKRLLEKHQKSILNLHKMRIKFIAHNNTKSLLYPDKILIKYGLKFEDIEALLNMASVALKNLHPDKNHLYTFDGEYNSVNDVDNLMRILCFGYQRKRIHLDRFVAGEIDDPKFPPSECDLKNI